MYKLVGEEIVYHTPRIQKKFEKKKKELESRVLGTLNTRFLSQNIAHNFLFVDEACIVFDHSRVALNFNSKFLN